MPSKILITGGTGLVGSKLCNELRAKEHDVRVLTTSAVKAEESGYFYWNLKDEYIDQKALEGIDYLIHLAGAGVADKRWSQKQKKIIYDSRIETANLLRNRLKGHKLKGMLTASAIGFYGYDTGDELMSEDDPKGEGFLADVVDDWEKAADAFSDISENISKLRIGVVLSANGGALRRMLFPFKLGLGSPLGSGNQFMSWIHIDDLVEMTIHSLENDLNGTYNATAPNPVTNRVFSKAVANTLGKPFFMPNVPGFLLKMMFGKMAQVVLGGNRVESKKITDSGFTFQFEKIDEALKDLLKK